MNGRTCGGCTVGCKIYAARPEVCRNFKCLWLAGWWQMGDELRPDRAGFMLDALPFGDEQIVAVVHCNRRRLRKSEWSWLLFEETVERLKGIPEVAAIGFGGLPRPAWFREGIAPAEVNRALRAVGQPPLDAAAAGRLGR